MVGERADGRAEHVDKLTLAEQPASDCENIAQVLSQTLVDPKKASLLGRVKVRRAHSRGPAELSAPRMHVFVWQQVCNPAAAAGVVDQITLPHAVHTRREMLQAETAEIVAARNQKMELRIMASAKKAPASFAIRL